MLNKVFDINQFNVLSDEENYYFFRALNMADNNDIENGITLDINGKIEKIRTNRERYEGTPKYKENDILTLEQMVDHIKMHQLKETNCISLTSNANTALSYGRGNYKDKYVMIKVPKKELGVSTYEAGLYMLEQINTYITSIIKDDSSTKELIEKIDNCDNKDDLEILKQKLNVNDLLELKQETTEDISLFEKGLENNITNSINYVSLNAEQNLEKDKIVLKIDLLNKQILPRISNRLLIQTIGNAFSSLELIHYGDIKKDEIIELPNECTDIFGLLQQMPDDLEYINEIKNIVLNKVQNMKFTGGFTYKDFDLEDDALSIENLYKITGGRISYGEAIQLYKNSFYLAKSKLRTRRSVQVLNRLLENNPKYYNTLNYILKNGYGIEPAITTRLSKDLVNVSESVSININENNSALVDYINSLSEQYLNYILDSPNNALKMLAPKFLDKKETVEKQEWIADAMIDMLDLSRLGIKFNLRYEQREHIKNALIKNNVDIVYFFLKRQNVKEKDIANVLFTNIIKNKKTINLNETFTLEELESFIGYNKVQGTELKLRKYQKPIVDNINKNFETKNFTSVILPTGSGKSYIALAEMYKFEKLINNLNKDNHAKILYLAPNEEILNQLVDIIRTIYKPVTHLTDTENMDVKRLFPNLTLTTYQNLKDRTDNDNTIKDIFNTKYDLIIFDELHRTGAREWAKDIDELIDNQDLNVKVLGITATPERDFDSKDMAVYWARKFKYTDEEILEEKHLSYNLDIFEAIKLGIVTSPKLVNCIYNLKSSVDDFKFSIDEIKNAEIREEKLRKYEKIRREVDLATGIEQVLAENIKQDSKYIVFLPIGRKCEDEDGNTVYEDENGNEVKQSIAYQIVNDYQILFNQYLFSNEYLKNNSSIINIYNKIINKDLLSENEINYLNKEKDNILLLSKFVMKYKQNNLISKNDVIANKIIEYMHWNKISKKELSSKLKERMDDRIEDYSMLGSYGAKANKIMLDKFNKSANDKTKLMFVMNKLNEGVHVNDISGIIWLRPMVQKSRILFLQQLGRCISSLDEGYEQDDLDSPIIIDLVNNSLNVNFKSNYSLEQDDLEKIIAIRQWINTTNKIPSGRSNDKEEKSLARNIVELQERYLKYIYNADLLKENMTYEKTIVKIGCDIDIWDAKIEFNTYDKLNNNYIDGDNLAGLLELEPITRDFIALKDELNECNINTFDTYYGFLQKLKEQGESTNLLSTDKIKVNDDGTIQVIKKLSRKINNSSVVINHKEYYADNLFSVGSFFFRNQEKFDDEQKQKLRDIGYILIGDAEDKFEKYYGYLLKLKEQGESTNLSRLDKIKICDDGKVEVIKRLRKDINNKKIIINQEEYFSDDLIRVGSWFDRKQKRFTETQKQKLRDVGYILIGDEDIFEKYYGYLLKLKEQGESTVLSRTDKIKICDDGKVEVIKLKHKMVNNKLIIINKKEYFSNGLINVADWLDRNQNKLAETQKQKLRNVGYVFKDEKEDLFEKYYGYLLKLKEQGESTNLSNTDKIKICDDGTIKVIKRIRKLINNKPYFINKEQYSDNSLFSAGNWLNDNQKKFSDEQKDKLRNVGYILKDEKKNIFEKYYGFLLKLKEQGESTNLTMSDKIKVEDDGSVQVIKNIVKFANNKSIVINSEEYSADNLFPVGNWLYNNEKKFSDEQKDKLRNVGYVFKDEKEDLFEKYFGYLLKLKEQGESIKLTSQGKIKVEDDGTVKVIKLSTKTINKKLYFINKEQYNDKNLFPVGNWFEKHEKQFSDEQKQRLRAIGFILKEDKKKAYNKTKDNFDSMSHDKVIQKVISNRENRNERKL